MSHLSTVGGKRKQETPAESDSFCAHLTPLSGWSESPRWGPLLAISSQQEPDNHFQPEA